MYTIYQVQGGDTLDSIANKLGVSKDELIKLNGLNNQNIMPGTYLVIPQNTLFARYIVKKGDNIYEIARKYNIELLTEKIQDIAKGDVYFVGSATSGRSALIFEILILHKF